MVDERRSPTARRTGRATRCATAGPQDRTARASLDTKDGIGFLHVPVDERTATCWSRRAPSPKVLNDGVAGYYTEPVKSALPQDQKGNFSLAAHRDGHGAKFHNIDKIEKGDPIVFETKDTWYVYKVYGILPRDLEVQRRRPRPGPEGVGQEEGGPLHHPDDLHARLHLHVPLRGVGRAGAHGEGRRGPDPAGGTALTLLRRAAPRAE